MTNFLKPLLKKKPAHVLITHAGTNDLVYNEPEEAPKNIQGGHKPGKPGRLREF